MCECWGRRRRERGSQRGEGRQWTHHENFPLHPYTTQTQQHTHARAHTRTHIPHSSVRNSQLWCSEGTEMIIFIKLIIRIPAKSNVWSASFISVIYITAQRHAAILRTLGNKHNASRCGTRHKTWDKEGMSQLSQLILGIWNCLYESRIIIVSLY